MSPFRLLKRLGALLKRVATLPLVLFDLLLAELRGLVRPGPVFVRRRWTGAVPLEEARRVAVFNHFDPQGRIHDYVLNYVDALHRAGFAVIFVSNSSRLTESEVEKVLPSVALAVKRSNVGWDFGAYRDGMLLAGPLERLDWLLITNDSVYGPLFDLEDTLAAADRDGADVYGITDNWDRQYHLQTYFVLFSRTAMANKGFRRFWSRVVHFRRKDWVIRRYEIGLTKTMLKHGMRCRALVPYRSVAAAMRPRIESHLAGKDTLPRHLRQYVEHVGGALHGGSPLNATHYFWDELVLTWRCPFLKRDLLQRNPVGIPCVQQWEDVIRRSGSAYDPDLILRHLEVSMRNRVY